MTTDYDFDNLLTYLLDLFGFPPLVYSLRVLYEQSSLSIPGWVGQSFQCHSYYHCCILQTAMIEGCYTLFKKFLCLFDFTEGKPPFLVYVYSFVHLKCNYIHNSPESSLY